jgi:hypothetical protein
MTNVHKVLFSISLLVLMAVTGGLILAQGMVSPVAAQEPTPASGRPAPAPAVQPSSLVTETFGSAALGGRDYSIAVVGAEQDYVPGDSPDRPPAGSKWVLVAANLNNLGGETVTITADSLVLLDQLSNRYAPDPAGAEIQPALVGASLSQGSSVLGLVRFQVPTGTTGKSLEWCPGGPAVCVQPITSPIPYTP